MVDNARKSVWRAVANSSNRQNVRIGLVADSRWQVTDAAQPAIRCDSGWERPKIGTAPVGGV